MRSNAATLAPHTIPPMTKSSFETIAPLFHPADLKAPGPLLLMLEGRAPWEYAALLVAAPWLRQIPKGDGHPVIVYPGLGANDITTRPLRRFLRDRGYTAYAWKQGFNLGPRDGVLREAREQLRQIAERHHEKVSLVGWSLGGVYARELAKELAEHVRCVVTLGSPFAGHPRATNAWRFFEFVSGNSVHDEEMIAQIRKAPPVPTTSIYSRTDGVVAWQCSINEHEPHTENIEVHASHVGMGMNPLALYVIADRLQQQPESWQRFDTRGARRWFFKTTHHSPMQATMGI
jgi:pimeloyl-ACP methyl ester carboxylesterase